MGGLTLKGKVLGVAFLLVIQAVGFGDLTALGTAPGVAHTFGAFNTTTTTSLASTGTTGAGDLLVAVIRVRNTVSLATVSGVTDSASNAWSKAAGVTQGTQADMEVWYAPNAAGVTSVTATVTSASALAETVFDITGALTSSPLDKTATLSGSSTAASTGTTAATSQASEIAIAGIGWNGTTATPSGQTTGYATTAIQKSTATGAATGEQAAWQILTAPGTQTYGATLSASAAWTGAIATFKLGSVGPVPTIASFSPTSGTDGTSVTINGTNFTGATAVAFHGTPQPSYTVNGPGTQITTTVPSGATTGTITVTTAGGTATSSTSFTVKPAITGINPSNGGVGTSVVITGSGLTGATAVDFNGKTASFTVPDDFHIDTSVPAGATSGPINVTTPGGSASSSTFTVTTATPPTITDFNPKNGSVGTPVTITGTNFTGATAVGFTGASQTALTVDSNTQITTTVPSGATTGKLTVTTPGGTSAPSTQTFTVAVTTAPHIMVIVEENHSYKWTSSTGNQGIIGNPNAPYINNTLAAGYLSATNWYSLQHGSPLLYEALIAGNTKGNFNSPSALPTIATELDLAGISWKAYEESMPSPCYRSNYPAGTGATTAVYSTDHNPFLYYAISSSECQAKNVSYAQFQTDLSNNALPDFAFLVPNNCNDMHTACTNGVPDGACKPTPCPKKDTWVKQGDTWLQSNLPAILASSWYQQGGTIIITWDEGFTTDTTGWVNGAACSSCGGGTIPTLIVSASNAQLSNHNYTTGGNLYGILRGVEEAYGVGLLDQTSIVGNGDLKPAFGQTTTGAVSGTVTDNVTHAAVVGATVSYSGGSTTTDGGGNYTLAGIAPGSYTVTAAATGYTTQNAPGVAVTAGVTTTKDFALAPQSGSISGTVTAASGGAPIGGATISYGGGSTTTDGSGYYTLSSLTEGSYTLTASATGYSSQNASDTVGPGAAVTQNFALLPPPGSITGHVTDAQTSSAISGATVSYSGGSATTDGTGLYTLINVPPGTYTVTAAAADHVAGSAPVTVTSGNPTTQDFLLTQTGTISGTVTDAATTNPIQGATVSYSGGSTVTSAGQYTFSQVDPSGSPYTVSVSASGYASQTSSPLTVTAGSTTTQNFALTASQQLVFSDGFESGNFSAWTSSTNMSVESTSVHSGTYAAQGNVSSSTADARKTLPTTYGTAYMRVWFDILSQGSTSRVNVLSARTTAGVSISSLFISPGGQVGILNSGETSSHVSTLPGGKVAAGWNELELYVVVNGASSSTEVWLNGAEVMEGLSVSGTANLGTTQVGMVQIGSSSSQTWNADFDDAAFDTQFIP
jgi:hypothetical protein